MPCDWILLGLWLFEFFQPKNSEAQGMYAESLLSLPILSYFLLICVSHHICFLMIPVLCHANGYSWGYGCLSFFQPKNSEAQGMNAESLLSLLILSYFFLICVLHHICFLMIPVLCHATRYSWGYGHLSFFNRKILKLKV